MVLVVVRLVKLRSNATSAFVHASTCQMQVPPTIPLFHAWSNILLRDLVRRSDVADDARGFAKREDDDAKSDDGESEDDDESKLSLRTVRHKLESMFASTDRSLDLRPFVIGFESNSLYGNRAAFESTPHALI